MHAPQPNSPQRNNLYKTVGTTLTSPVTASRRPELDQIMDPSFHKTQSFNATSSNSITSPQRKVTQKANVSHFFGFGNIQVGNLKSPVNMNRTVTGQEQSGKFQEKLQLKQKQVEALLLENRLRKLQNEEIRLQKQIRIANKHSQFADEVVSRREYDSSTINQHKNGLMEAEMRQRDLNNQRRYTNQQSVNAHHNHVLTQNRADRAHLKSVTDRINNAVFTERENHLQERKAARDLSLSLRHKKEDKTRFDRANYNQTVTQMHNSQAEEHLRLREANELRIKHLEEVEARMVQDLQKTLQKKNDAVNQLHAKSKGLKNVMQPRMAYKYGGMGDQASVSKLTGLTVMDPDYDPALNMYTRRNKSVAGSEMPGAAGPSSGHGLTANSEPAKEVKEDVENEGGSNYSGN